MEVHVTPELEKKVSDFAAQNGLSPCARTSTRDERTPEAFIFMDGYALHPEAFTDLDDIAAHKQQDSADAALGLVDDICRAIESLVAFPEQGFRRPNLTNRPLRFIDVREYWIAYAPDRKPIWIVAVMHGKRSPRTIAAVLRGRDE